MDCKKNQQKTMKPSENVLKLQKSHKTKQSMSTATVLRGGGGGGGVTK